MKGIHIIIELLVKIQEYWNIKIVVANFTLPTRLHQPRKWEKMGGQYLEVLQ